VGFAAAVLGLIWLLAGPEADRWWGAVAMLVGIAMTAWVWFAQRA
jgi:hypothetical protein